MSPVDRKLKASDENVESEEKRLDQEKFQEEEERRLWAEDLAESSAAASKRSKKFAPKLRPHGCVKCNRMFQDKSGVEAHQPFHFREKKGTEICGKCGNRYEMVGKLRGTHKCPRLLLDNYLSRRVLDN